MFEEEPSSRFARDKKPLKIFEITKFFRKIDSSRKNIFDSVGWSHNEITLTKTKIDISGAHPSLKKRLSSLEDNKCLILPYNYRCKRHVAGIMLCRSPQKKAYVFDTGGDDGRTDKITEINEFLVGEGLSDYSVDNNSFLFGTIQGRCGCGFHVVNEAKVFKELGFKADVILQKAQTGELQFLVMSKSSNMMKSQTGGIQIIENLGAVTGTGTNVTIQGTREGRYMEFNLGNSRFKMSLSTNESVTGNKYISRPGLIRSIGDQSVLEAMRQHQSELPDNIKTAVEQRLSQLQPPASPARQPTVSPTAAQGSHLPPLNQNPRQVPGSRPPVGGGGGINPSTHIRAPSTRPNLKRVPDLGPLARVRVVPQGRDATAPQPTVPSGLPRLPRNSNSSRHGFPSH